jgi:hypothetical protein
MARSALESPASEAATQTVAAARMGTPASVVSKLDASGDVKFRNRPASGAMTTGST